MYYFGWNYNADADVSPYVAPSTRLRDYRGLLNGWPVEPRGLPALVSVRNDPQGIIAGDYDAQYTTALLQAPPNSLLTAWHEADHDPKFSAATAVAIHEHMYNLVHETTPNVTYGVITTQWVPSEPGYLKQWCPPGMDWYGVDLYDLGGTTDPVKTLENTFAQMPKGCAKVIGETNSSVESRRPDWFNDVYGWLKQNNGADLLTFWSGGKLSGPFLPNDKATVKALNEIAANAAV